MGSKSVRASWVTLNGKDSSIDVVVGSNLPFNFIKVESILAMYKNCTHNINFLNLFTLNNYAHQVMASIRDSRDYHFSK